MNANPTAYLILAAVPLPSPFSFGTGYGDVPAIGKVWTLLPGKNLLGRQSCPDAIVLPWIFVSRRHALIELFTQGLWEIEDHSTNGTAVNGQKLEPNALTPLNDGDRIRLGYVELIFCRRLDPETSMPNIDDQHT